MNIGRVLSPILFAMIVAVASVPAQVPVREEPRHKVVLENDFVRVIDVRLPSGDTTVYHVHTVPSVVVELAATTIRSQEMGKPPAEPRHVAPGETRYAPYDETPLTHRVTNEGTSGFHVLDIELVRPMQNGAWNPPLLLPGMKLEWEQKLVRTYQGRIEAAQRGGIPSDNFAHLLIGISGTVDTAARIGGRESKRKLSAEEFLYFPARTSIQITGGAASAAYVLLELR